jgi:hypothetical protein
MRTPLSITSKQQETRKDADKDTDTDPQIHRSTDPQIHRSTDPQIHRHRSTDPQIHRHTDPQTQIHRPTDKTHRQDPQTRPTDKTHRHAPGSGMCTGLGIGTGRTMAAGAVQDLGLANLQRAGACRPGAPLQVQHSRGLGRKLQQKRRHTRNKKAHTAVHTLSLPLSHATQSTRSCDTLSPSLTYTQHKAHTAVHTHSLPLSHIHATQSTHSCAHTLSLPLPLSHTHTRAHSCVHTLLFSHMHTRHMARDTQQNTAPTGFADVRNTAYTCALCTLRSVQHGCTQVRVGPTPPSLRTKCGARRVKGPQLTGMLW